MDFNEHGVYDDIDNTPKIVGAIVLGSVAVIALFKVVGFRFNFGANVGGK